MKDHIEQRRRKFRMASLTGTRHSLSTELRACRKMLEDTEHAAHIGNWRFDIMRRRVYWSREASRILEISPLQASGHDIFLARIHPDDRARVTRAYADVAQQGGQQLIEYRLAFPDGRIKDVRERRAVCSSPDGRPSCISGTIQDITDIRIAEAMLQGEKSRLRTFLNAIPDLVWIKDTEGVYLACNPVFERFLGAEEADIAGKTDYDFVDTALANYFRQKDREAIVAGRACVNENWVEFAHDGRRVLLETIKTPFRDDLGNIAGVLGIARDITERKRIEEQLHLREQDFRTIAENSPDPIARYDKACRCVYMNPALQRLLGNEALHFLGKTPLEASNNLEALRPYEDRIHEALHTGRETELELITDALGLGRQVCDHIRFTPEHDREGKVVSVLAVGRDVAGFKEIERRLSHSGRLLRTLVARQDKDREAERKRVAWEVHEELGQLLAALRFELLHAQGAPATHPNALSGPSESAMQILDRAFHIVRGLTSSLRPHVLDFGIDAALEWLADSFRRHTGMPCTLRCLSPAPLNEELVTVLFRAAQEALDNIARRANARSVEIVIEQRGDEHVLTVRDDGRGFEGELPLDGKLGLLLIEERVRTVNGSMSFASTQGVGAVLEVRIPFQ
jgi:PAS domain S-box-containing protein